ncbi:MAG: T9SS type A sorting domain-containing protein [Phycisphaerales bacterium]|nr:T9SS type A sorting domain-containing protein [Phycisphaerales bacterium]
MNKYFYPLLLLLCCSFAAQAQKTDPAPYCLSEFNNNYNMMKEIAAGSYKHSFGTMGSVNSLNTYLYVDTAHLPNISKATSSTIFLDFYSTPDVEPAYFGIWIDYDQSKTFDATELIFYNHNIIKSKLPSGASGGISLPLTIKAPALAKLGVTRMRIVRAQKNADPTGAYDSTFKLNPCNTKTPGGNTYGCTYDFDVTIDGMSAIEESFLQSQLHIAPNPATDKISIINTSTQKITQLTLFDLSGKKLYESESATEINISEYPSGIYFTKITLDNGLVVPMKFVKQ